MTVIEAAPSAIRTCLTRLRDVIAGAGVPATLDANTVPTPGAWITPRWISGLTLDGSGILTAHVYLVAGDLPAVQALDVLGGLLALVEPVVDISMANGDVIDTAQSVVLPHSPSTPMPAFRLVVDLDYPGEDN